MRDEARALLAKGINPKVHRKQKRQAVQLAAEHTFATVYEKWLAHRKLVLKEGRQSTLQPIPWDKGTGIRTYYVLNTPGHASLDELMAEYQQIVQQLETTQQALKTELMTCLGGKA